MRTTHHLPSVRLAILTAVAALSLAGCSAAGGGSGTDAPAPAGDSISIADAWVKSADGGMSAAFGEITNTGSEEITVESASSPASSSLELHETVEDDAGQMIMRQKEGGFVIPAGESLTLKPGANHIMLMDVTTPLKAGEEAGFTLTFSDGSTFEFTAPVKDFTGADETYVGGEGGEMDMDHMDDMDDMDDHMDMGEQG